MSKFILWVFGFLFSAVASASVLVCQEATDWGQGLYECQRFDQGGCDFEMSNIDTGEKWRQQFKPYDAGIYFEFSKNGIAKSMILTSGVPANFTYPGESETRTMTCSLK